MTLKSLHHAHFSVHNIDKMEHFAKDFGLTTVERSTDRLYMRTAGGDAYAYIAERGEPGFKAIGFTVDTQDDLTRAVAEHGATPVTALDGPGGGQSVSLVSPEGFRFDLLHGVQEADPDTPPCPLVLNVPGMIGRERAPQSTRRIGPAHLYRLGHVGFYVRNLKAMRDWLVSVLGMRVSDDVYIGSPENVVVSFLRLDRGAALTDHHCIFLVQYMDRCDFHHASFEAQDYEAQFRAHRYLADQGWTSLWGVGRHGLGSHVFDTWFAPDGYRFETFSDTDMVDSAHVAGLHDMAKSDLDVWSSESPEKYFA
jgi:catechol 2,3-dioxygenase-like lactoylglutathione lyase family enzyme